MNDVAEIAAKKAVKQISMKTKDITVFQIAREAAYAKQRLQITKVDIAYPVTYNYSINDAFWSAFVAVDNVLNNLEHRKECSEKILKRIEKEKDRLRDYDDTLIES